MKIKVLAVIPARYDSTRLPGKPLVDISGKPMVQRVWEQVKKADLIDKTVIATDDERIVDATEKFNGIAIMTSKSHKSGTDRIAEVANQFDCDFVINIQGDEPLINPEVINATVLPLLKDDNILMSSCMTNISNKLDIENPNVVKVITDCNNNAIYFSRNPLPFNRDNVNNPKYFKHIGIYCYRKDFLLKYCKLNQPEIEKMEKLEQLRALFYGYKIHMIKTDYNSIGVDTKEDIAKIEEKLKKEE